MLGGPQEELTVLPYHLSVPFLDPLSQPDRMILKPRRKNTKSPDGGETLGAVEDGTWEERARPFLSSEIRFYT